MSVLTHVPVLAEELLALLDPREGDRAIDGTFGDGGHARVVAAALGAGGELIAVDRDPAARERFDRFAADAPCHTAFVAGTFAEALHTLGVADCVWLDLGVSSMQVDDADRGFSYIQDGPLDMRMDPTRGESAADLVNTRDERDLARLFKVYGEERYAGPIARAIGRARPLTTTLELADVVRAAVPAPARFAAGHPAKRVFQALRIAVNGELDQLERGLDAAFGALAPGGRLAILTFHSLEDRMVKRFMVDRARACVCPPDLPVCVCDRVPDAELLTTRAIAPRPAEVERNSRARSAKLRGVRRVPLPERRG